ncbi:grpE protein homolog 2, mitochondrial-like isoform X1 [Zingiber officinale]|uniref:grpE protein homolog 2, mitochondrial-like isoform X1 n=1 Tax=Zingiber officinale TaxID=94328 RepID=UPI001C4C13EB|nr:grpE protein homolog 2, mitochondrial-like isoform X1 [Zingiber officinale]
MASRVFSRSVRGSFRYRLLDGVVLRRLSREPAAGSAILPLNKLQSAPLHSNLWLSRSIATTTLQRFGFSSAASPQPIDETNLYDTLEFGNSSDIEISPDPELSRDELVKLIVEKEKLNQLKVKELEEVQDKVLRCHAEIENIIERKKREAENSRKFSIQSFVMSLLDVADNLTRASSVVKERFTKLDTSKCSTEVVPLLQTLLEGVELTDKQLSEVFSKFGVAKFDPINEQFDPHRHSSIFQVPDSTRPPGIVAAVLKSGYTLHDRVIRPAEVGVTQELNE